jgi:hypothetical protein
MAINKNTMSTGVILSSSLNLIPNILFIVNNFQVFFSNNIDIGLSHSNIIF